MSGSKYPNKISGFAQLPLVADLTSPVLADDINRIRDAVVAVETELGINPSGTFGTVRSRIDGLESLVQFLNDGYSVSLTTDYLAGLIETPSDKSYTITLNIPFSGFIDSVSTICVSGTATATVEINGTPLGGSSNSVSTSEDVVIHSSDNTFLAGDDIVLTISSNSSSADVSFTVVYVRT